MQPLFKTSDEERDTEYAGDVLYRLGVPLTFAGHTFLSCMIGIVCHHPDEAQLITKSLYPRIGRAYRMHREAIGVACSRAIAKAYEQPMIYAIDGYLDKNNKRLSPSAFISLTAEKIRKGEL